MIVSATAIIGAPAEVTYQSSTIRLPSLRRNLARAVENITTMRIAMFLGLRSTLNPMVDGRD